MKRGLLIVALVSACSHKGVSLLPPTPAGECILMHDNTSGVIGMDGAGSIELGGGRSLFSFGDTFYGGYKSDGQRDVHGAVHSSTTIALDSGAASCFSGATFRPGSGTPAQWLQPASDMAWPLGPMMHLEGDSLALLFTWVKGDPTQGLGFDVLGNGIATGPLGSPTISVDVHATAPPQEAQPAAWLLDGGFAYLYRCGARLGHGGLNPCVVGRAPAASLAAMDSYRYWVAGRGYTGSYGEASIVMEGAPAFTVTKNAFLGAYLEVYVEPFSPRVSVRTAAAPEGPFSERHDVWPCSLPEDDVHSFCYAAFEHPQLGSPDGRRIVVSYSTNTTDFGSMLRHPNLNWPRMTTVDLATLR